MASAGGGARATDEIREVEMAVTERPPEDLGRVGSKRVRDSLNGKSSQGFSGVTTSEKASIVPNNTSNIGGHYLHGTHGERMLPDCNISRSSISSSGENLGHMFKRPAKICTFYAKGRCNKGSCCTFLHKIEGPGSDHRWNSEENAAILAADAYGNSRGFDKRSKFTLEASHGMSIRTDDTLINELVPDPVVYERHQEPSMGHYSGLTPESYLDGRCTSSRLLDGGFFQSAAVKRIYLEVNNSDSKQLSQSFDQPIPPNPLQWYEKFSAYGGTTGHLPNTHHIHNLSSHAPYSPYSLPGFRNPRYATSDHSFCSPTSHLGRLSHHLSTPVIEGVDHYKSVDVGTSTSRLALLPSSSHQPSIMSPGPLSPIKDEVWVTSVPFVPSFDFPYIKTPDSLKDGNKNNFKSSSPSIEHINDDVVTPKSLNHDDKLAKNMHAKGSNDAANINEKTRDFRFRLAEHIKELIKPFWKEGYLSRDAHKLVVKKSMDKILSSIEPDQTPTSEDAISNYIIISESKIEKLVKAYVDRLKDRKA